MKTPHPARLCGLTATHARDFAACLAAAGIRAEQVPAPRGRFDLEAFGCRQEALNGLFYEFERTEEGLRLC